MILKRLYDDKLAQASYLIGCAASGDALIVDPNRDLEQYLDAAEEEGLQITAVTETHIHADYVSGSQALAARTGAHLYLSDEGDAQWKYAFAKEAGAHLLHHGDVFQVGNIRIDVVHTPGHTPEHLTFLVTDTAGADEPIGALTGDFIFVGDVGRPDLLERAARFEGTMEESARTLFHSLRTFTEGHPDWLQIWPGHGAGSACGKGLSSIPHSTLGYEKRFNWAFTIESEQAFVDAVLAGQPEPPTYFARMKRVNKEGPPILDPSARPARIPDDRLERMIRQGVMVIDTRPRGEYARGHVPGTINIPLDRSFNSWAGWLVAEDRELALIVDPERIEEAARDLTMVGIDRITGFFPPTVVDDFGWDRPLGTITQMDADELARRRGAEDIAVLDVRGRTEWDEGHLPDALHIPLGHLPERMDEVPRDRPVVVHCKSGARSAIAASLLQAAGIPRVINLSSGFDGWTEAGRPVERTAPAAAV